MKTFDDILKESKLCHVKSKCNPQFFLYKIKRDENIKDYTKTDLENILIENFGMSQDEAINEVGLFCLSLKYDGIKLRE